MFGNFGLVIHGVVHEPILLTAVDANGTEILWARTMHRTPPAMCSRWITTAGIYHLASDITES